MNLTPLDIRKKEFRKAMRGCDPDEVESFLLEVSEAFEALMAERDQLKTRTESLEKEASELEKKAKTASRSDDSYASKEAELIIREAELKALETLEKNRAERNRLQEEIVVLKQQKNSFIKRLKHLFAAQLDLIDVLDIEDVELEEIRGIQKQKERKKISSRQIEQVPSFKRSEQKQRLNFPAQDEPSANIDMNSLKNGDASDLDLDSIKKRAKELLDKNDSSVNQKSESEDINLDDILGKIGENDS